jgi:hypothetical protein
MEILNLDGAKNTPKVILDKDRGVFEISGQSLTDNAAEFYRSVLVWLKKYAADPNPSTEFVFKLEYINTASSKMILDVITSLEGIKDAKVLWYFQEDDEDMEERGEELAQLVNVPFEFKAL